MIVVKSQDCTESSEVPRDGGNTPLCACGAWLIAHKVVTSERLLGRLGDYLNHITNLTEHPAASAVERLLSHGIYSEVER